MHAKGYCTENPATEVPQQREPRQRPKALDDKQLKRLLDVPDRITFFGVRDYTIMVLPNRHLWAREAAAWSSRSGCVVFLDLDPGETRNPMSDHR